MKNVYILCEGQTEETFINRILVPYFINMDILVQPIILETSRTPKKKYKGGVSSYGKIKKEITILSKSHKNEIVTSMFDYYAMPTDTPNIDNNESNIYERMNQIEKAITKDIGQLNCFFNLCLHEFESLLFSKPECFSLVAEDSVVKSIHDIRNSFDTPEHINNSKRTAPSKRLEQLIPSYAKVKNGEIVSTEIGIDTIINECKHFNKWIQKIKDC